MPKYDAKTIDSVLEAVRAMQICCSVVKHHMESIDQWGDDVEQFHNGMYDAYSNVIELLNEMKNTAEKKHEKA